MWFPSLASPSHMHSSSQAILQTCQMILVVSRYATLILNDSLLVFYILLKFTLGSSFPILIHELAMLVRKTCLQLH